jgi:hypothetical protein
MNCAPAKTPVGYLKGWPSAFIHPWSGKPTTRLCCGVASLQLVTR